MSLNRSEQPSLRTLSQFEIQSVEESLLNNDIPLHIINASTEEVVRVDVVFRAGRSHQEVPLQAWFTSLLLKEGTMASSSKEIAEKLDYYGAFIVPSSSVEHSSVSLYTLNKYVEETTNLLFELLTTANFPTTELERIKEQRKQRFLLDCTKVDYLSQRHFNTLIYGQKHPLGKVIQLEQFEQLQRQDLLDFYTTYYNSKHASIYLSGCVTNQVVETIAQKFGEQNWGMQQEPKIKRIISTPITQHARHFYHHAEAVQNAVRVGGHVIEQNDPDSYPLNVLVTLLGGYFGSRLMRNIREEKGYTYGINAGLSYFCKAGVFHISTETATENTEAVIQEIYKEIAILQKTEVNHEELQRVQNYMYGTFCRNYETSFAVADACIYTQVNQLPNNHIQKSFEAIQRVTPAQLKELANDYLSLERLAEVVVGEKTQEINKN